MCALLPAHRSAVSLLAVVNDVLDFSRIEADRTGVAPAGHAR